jgi:plasmid stability protein
MRLSPINFTDRLTAYVPDDMGAAVRHAADRDGLSIADYVRDAVTAKLRGEGVRVMLLPPLCRRRDAREAIAR